jgi:uncharacterized protein YjbK
MLEPRLFHDVETAVSSFFSELRSVLDSLGTTVNEASFEETKQQRIEFIDTEQFDLRENGLLLRQRTLLAKKKTVELTLKCRSPDFCLPVAFRETAEQHQARKVLLSHSV